MPADDHDVTRSRQWEEVAVVLEQYDSLLGVGLADRFVRGEVYRRARGYGIINHTLREHRAEDARGHVVEPRFRHLAGSDRGLERRAEEGGVVERPAAFLVEPAQ